MCERHSLTRVSHPPKKGGPKVGKTKRGKGTKIMAVADRHGLPVSVCVESASPHEVTLATSTLVQMVISDAPQNFIGDNAYDSDQLDTELKFYGIELIAAHRRNRNNKTARPASAKAISTTLENRTAFRLVAELSTSRRPI
jgi:Transposase DDE domain